MLESVIFDFDGVLINSPEFYIRYTKKYFRGLGVGLTKQDISAIVGHPYQYKLDYLNRVYSLSITKDAFLEKIGHEMKQDMERSAKTPDNIVNVLEELRGTGVKAYVASSNVESNIVFYLKKFGIRHYFSGIVALDHGFRPKPAPDIYAEVLRRTGRKGSSCVAVEDTQIGVESASKAGLRVIAVPNKFTSSQDFLGADLIVDNFNELNIGVFRDAVS